MMHMRLIRSQSSILHSLVHRSLHKVCAGNYHHLYLVLPRRLLNPFAVNQNLPRNYARTWSCHLKLIQLPLIEVRHMEKDRRKEKNRAIINATYDLVVSSIE